VPNQAATRFSQKTGRCLIRPSGEPPTKSKAGSCLVSVGRTYPAQSPQTHTCTSR
jgi:hypothetical protein